VSVAKAATPVASKEVAKKESKKDKKAKRAEANDGLKRPLSAYMLFNNYRRPALREQDPSATLPALSKIIGAEWKGMSEDQKSKWDTQAKNLKLDYEIEKHQIQVKNGGASVGQGQGQVSSAVKKVEKVGEKRTHEQTRTKDADSSSLTSNKRARSGSDSSDL